MTDVINNLENKDFEQCKVLFKHKREMDGFIIKTTRIFNSRLIQVKEDIVNSINFLLSLLGLQASIATELSVL